MNKENLQYADSESDGVFAQRKELEGNKSSNPSSHSEERQLFKKQNFISTVL